MKFKNIFIEGAIAPDFIGTSIQKHSLKKGIGGHSIFLGQVRADEKEGGVVNYIEYTAYEEMALKQAHQIREETFEKYPLSCMHIYHSLGKVKTGEICLFVFTSSAHRKPANEACAELVERIKSEIPVWGREHFGEDQTVWKENQ